MKFLKPLGLSNLKKPASFGQKRAQSMNQALEKAQQERKQLLKKQYASPEPLNSYYQQKGNRLDAQIRKLKDEVK